MNLFFRRQRAPSSETASKAAPAPKGFTLEQAKRGKTPAEQIHLGDGNPPEQFQVTPGAPPEQFVAKIDGDKANIATKKASTADSSAPAALSSHQQTPERLRIQPSPAKDAATTLVGQGAAKPDFALQATDQPNPTLQPTQAALSSGAGGQPAKANPLLTAIAKAPTAPPVSASSAAMPTRTQPSATVAEKKELPPPVIGVIKKRPKDAKPIISVKGVTKVYHMGDIEVQALRGVDINIYSGDIMAIMGPSGSGKSTLMNVLGCLDVPSDGEYILDGVDVRQLNDNELANIRSLKIGFVFQSFNLLPRTTALANVELPLLYAGISGRERHRRAREALSLVGLADRLDHHPNELSGGQQQRVAIARALVTRPAMILADEPTGNLDSKTRAEIMQLFQHLNRDQGITILFVTHDPETAEYCERVVFIRDGVIARDEYRQVTVGIHAPAEGQTAPPNYYSVMSNLFQGAPDAAAAPVDTDASPSPISPAEAVNVAEDNKPPDQALSQSAAPASVETPPADANQAAPMEAAQPETAVDAEAAEDVALEASAEKAAQVAEPPLPPVIAPLPTQPARREFPIL